MCEGIQDFSESCVKKIIEAQDLQRSCLQRVAKTVGERKRGERGRCYIYTAPVITERLTRTGNYRAAAVGSARGGFMNKLRT